MTILRKLGLLLIISIVVSACNAKTHNQQYRVIYNQDLELSSQERGSNLQYTIAIVPKLEGIEYFEATKDGALEAAKELGVNVIYKGPHSAGPEEQIKVIQELIDQKVDVIAVSANDPDKLIPVLKQAVQKNIKVITWDADTAKEGREFFINMVDPETLGRHLMDTLAWSTEEKGEFAIITGSYSASNLNEWIHWINIQREEYYPNMKLLEIVASDDDMEKAYQLAKQLLEDHENLIGIIGNSSVGPPGAAKAVKEAGKEEQVKVVGVSTPNLMRAYLHEDAAQVVTLWSTKRLGYLTVALAKNLLEGTLPYDGQEIYNVGKIRLKGDMVIMGEPLDFTKENVNQYDF